MNYKGGQTMIKYVSLIISIVALVIALKAYSEVKNRR